MTTEALHERGSRVSTNALLNILKHFASGLTDEQLQNEIETTAVILQSLRIEAGKTCSFDAHRHAARWVDQYELSQFICREVLNERSIYPWQKEFAAV